MEYIIIMSYERVHLLTKEIVSYIKTQRNCYIPDDKEYGTEAHMRKLKISEWEM
jgi:hypothetical protein